MSLSVFIGYVLVVPLSTSSSNTLADLDHFRCNRDSKQRRDIPRWRTMGKQHIALNAEKKSQSLPDTVSRRTIYQLTDKKGITSRRTSIQPLINASFNDFPRVLAKSLFHRLYTSGRSPVP